MDTEPRDSTGGPDDQVEVDPDDRAHDDLAHDDVVPDEEREVPDAEAPATGVLDPDRPVAPEPNEPA